MKSGANLLRSLNALLLRLSRMLMDSFDLIVLSWDGFVVLDISLSRVL